MTDRPPLVAGNWKMHKLRAEAADLATSLATSLATAMSDHTGASGHCAVAVFPPFTALASARQALAGSAVLLGGQACHAAPGGAHTGEISAAMLADAGCTLVLAGHSERRAAGQSDADVGACLSAGLAAGLGVILCVGETLEQREAGTTVQVILRQCDAGLHGLTAGELDRVDLAYEPVWAIGTGRTATPETAAEAHAVLRARLVEKFGDAGRGPRILYGGSVKPGNAAELMSTPEVGGVLVGGASLEAESFAAIVAAAPGGATMSRE